MVDFKTTTFIGINITMFLFFGPIGVVQWERYISGFYHVIFIAEEDITLDITNVWNWTDEAELAIGYCILVIWLGVAGGTIRIAHDKYIRHIEQQRVIRRRQEENQMRLANDTQPQIFPASSPHQSR